ncbi:MAG: DUF167 domain-containing protein [Patescibacteria group bacterium]|nr:DUF167 domain-containing protein [Patescibacteria group bacterium]
MLVEFKRKLENGKILYLRIKANPGMAKTEIKQVMADGTIKINIAAPAEKGKANQALLSFLVKEFGVSKEGISIISGAGEKLKLVKIIK